MNNKILGKIGEDFAVSYLEKKSYKIIERNFQNRWGETDIIAKRNNTVIFAEVKTRIGERFGLPEDAINKNKMYRLARNAQKYMAFKSDTFYRVDAICIVLDESKKLKRISHYKSITSE